MDMDPVEFFHGQGKDLVKEELLPEQGPCRRGG